MVKDLFILFIHFFFLLSSSNWLSFFKDFIYLAERDTAREGTEAGKVGVGEAGFLQSRELYAGLDPRTQGA